MNSVFANSITYSIGNLLLKAFSFLLLPLYTAYLSTEQYGVLNLASSFYTIVGCFVTLSLQFSVARFYADIKDDKEKVAKMYGTIILFVTFIGFLISVLLLLFHNFLTEYLFNNIPFYPIILLSIAISVVNGLYSIYQDILKGMQEAKRSVILSFVFFFLLIGLNILTVVVFEKGEVGILFSYYLVYSFMIVVMMTDLMKRRLFKFCIDFSLLKGLLKYSLPILPHSLAWNFSNYANRVIICSKLSLSHLGLYSLSMNFGLIADVVLNSVQSAFQPWFYQKLNEKRVSSQKEITRNTTILMMVYGFFFIIVGLFSQEAILIMTSSSYSAAWLYIPIIVFSIAAKSPLYFYNNFLYYNKKKTVRIFYSTFIGTIICIIFTWLLVPILGILGTIIADIIALAVRTLYIFLAVRKESCGIYSFFKLEYLSLFPMAILLVGILPSYLLFNAYVISFSNILYKFAVLFIYVFFVYKVYGFNLHSIYSSLKNHER